MAYLRDQPLSRDKENRSAYLQMVGPQVGGRRRWHHPRCSVGNLWSPQLLPSRDRTHLLMHALQPINRRPSLCGLSTPLLLDIFSFNRWSIHMGDSVSSSITLSHARARLWTIKATVSIHKSINGGMLPRLRSRAKCLSNVMLVAEYTAWPLLLLLSISDGRWWLWWWWWCKEARILESIDTFHEIFRMLTTSRTITQSKYLVS